MALEADAGRFLQRATMSSTLSQIPSLRMAPQSADLQEKEVSSTSNLSNHTAAGNSANNTAGAREITTAENSPSTAPSNLPETEIRLLAASQTSSLSALSPQHHQQAMHSIHDLHRHHHHLLLQQQQQQQQHQHSEGTGILNAVHHQHHHHQQKHPVPSSSSSNPSFPASLQLKITSVSRHRHLHQHHPYQKHKLQQIACDYVNTSSEDEDERDALSSLMANGQMTRKAPSESRRKKQRSAVPAAAATAAALTLQKDSASSSPADSTRQLSPSSSMAEPSTSRSPAMSETDAPFSRTPELVTVLMRTPPSHHVQLDVASQEHHQLESPDAMIGATPVSGPSPRPSADSVADTLPQAYAADIAPLFDKLSCVPGTANPSSSVLSASEGPRHQQFDANRNSFSFSRSDMSGESGDAAVENHDPLLSPQPSLAHSSSSQRNDTFGSSSAADANVMPVLPDGMRSPNPFTRFNSKKLAGRMKLLVEAESRPFAELETEHERSVTALLAGIRNVGGNSSRNELNIGGHGARSALSNSMHRSSSDWMSEDTEPENSTTESEDTDTAMDAGSSHEQGNQSPLPQLQRRQRSRRSSVLVPEKFRRREGDSSPVTFSPTLTGQDHFLGVRFNMGPAAMSPSASETLGIASGYHSMCPSPKSISITRCRSSSTDNFSAQMPPSPMSTGASLMIGSLSIGSRPKRKYSEERFDPYSLSYATGSAPSSLPSSPARKKRIEMTTSPKPFMKIRNAMQHTMHGQTSLPQLMLPSGLEGSTANSLHLGPESLSMFAPGVSHQGLSSLMPLSSVSSLSPASLTMSSSSTSSLTSTTAATSTTIFAATTAASLLSPRSIDPALSSSALSSSFSPSSSKSASASSTL